MPDVEQKNSSTSSTAQLDKLIRAVSQSQHRYRELIDNLDQAVFTLSPDGEVHVANRLLSEILGVPFNELIGHRLQEFLAEPDLEKAKVWLLELVARGSWSATIPVRLRNESRIRYFRCWFQAVVDEARVSSIIGWARDITDQEESETRFTELFDLLQEACFVTNVGGKILDANPALVNMFGYGSKQEMLAANFRDLYDNPSDREEAVGILQEKGVLRDREIVFVRKDGKRICCTCRVSVVRDASGLVARMLGTLVDITEKKLAENQLAQKEKLTSMGQMLAGAAHELNNPLTAILGVGDLLRERAVDDTTRRHAELILQQSRRAAAIVQNLVSFSRPLSQGLLPVRVDEVVQQAIERQHELLQQHGIRVQYEVAPDLPFVNGDAKLLAQAFENLLTNAVQAISSVRSTGDMKVSIARARDSVRVSVTDDGVGISPENISKIFDPFFTTKRPGGGAGLGLTISMAVAKEHGGRIEVSSVLGQGATFDVLLPGAADQNSGPVMGLAPATSAAGSSHVLQGHTVLVVDDEENIREIVQEGLSARGMVVRGAESAETALSGLAESSCEVVLCDFNLPGLSGEELFGRLRAQQGDALPLFVFMTGELVDGGVVERIQESGARVLQKPFSISALVNLLAEVLEPHPAGTN
jgi:PAS domain S-box-containing protein